MALEGESVLIMEAQPVAYLSIACNEALKAARVKLIDVRVFGATGRLILTGPEAEIDVASAAASASLEEMNKGLKK